MAVMSLVPLGADPPAAGEPSATPPLRCADDVTTFVESTMAAMGGIPGLSMAVYTPGGVYARGFGVTDVRTGESVDETTAFYVASSTKSFTALALQILHQRDEIDLDMSLARFAPDAPYPPQTRPHEVTLRHLLTHTSGLQNGSIASRYAFTGDYSSEQMWQLIRFTTANESAPLGRFDYTNFGYNLLTLLTDRKLEQAWQDVLAREVYAPAGFTRTTSRISEAAREGWAIARPHISGLPEGTLRIELEKTDATMHSAGGTLMSANDALRWLELMLEKGTIDNRQVVPASAVAEVLRRAARVDAEFGPYTRESYGLGWYIGRYGLERMVHHFGSYPGFRAHISFLPERRIGVAVFVNDSGAGFTAVDEIANYVYDRHMEVPGLEARAAASIGRLVDRRDGLRKMIAGDRAERASRKWRLAQPLDAYTGTYESEEMGRVLVSVRDNRLFVRQGMLSSSSDPAVEDESIRVELRPLSGQILGFDVAPDGSVRALTIRGVRFERI